MPAFRFLPVLFLAAMLISGCGSAVETDVAPVVVVEVGGPMDELLIDSVVDAITAPNVHMFVLKIDSPGVSSGDLSPLFEAVDAAAAPVIAWIGPNPAVAYGGSAFLANHADIRSAAPGAWVGYLDPAVHRGEEVPPSIRTDDDPAAVAISVEALEYETLRMGAEVVEVPGFVDRLDPALGQLIASLDGVVVERGDTTFTLSTAETQVIDGQEVIVQTRPVRFVGPGLLDRFLRLAATPGAAFLFLVFGMAFAVFEFYAAGTGLMASVAGLSFILSGYGLATLPMRWPSVAVAIAGMVVLVWGFVQNRVDWRAVLGSLMLLGAGLTYTTTGPQYPPSTVMVVAATASAVVFVWYALTTVVRSRFATPTVGRDELIGRSCVAVSNLDPTGVVLVDGARWRATADRGIEISAGAAANIVGITGLVLEVDPFAGSSPNGPSESTEFPDTGTDKEKSGE
ncbi:MAG: NfeD family protein [Acidimicrobiia bacterium]